MQDFYLLFQTLNRSRLGVMLSAGRYMRAFPSKNCHPFSITDARIGNELNLDWGELTKIKWYPWPLGGLSLFCHFAVGGKCLGR